MVRSSSPNMDPGRDRDKDQLPHLKDSLSLYCLCWLSNDLQPLERLLVLCLGNQHCKRGDALQVLDLEVVIVQRVQLPMLL